MKMFKKREEVVALVRRGICGFGEKSLSAGMAGATAAIVVNNVLTPHTVDMTHTGQLLTFHVPTCMVGKADGDEMFDMLNASKNGFLSLEIVDGSTFEMITPKDAGVTYKPGEKVTVEFVATSDMKHVDIILQEGHKYDNKPHLNWTVKTNFKMDHSRQGETGKDAAKLFHDGQRINRFTYTMPKNLHGGLHYYFSVRPSAKTAAVFQKNMVATSRYYFEVHDDETQLLLKEPFGTNDNWFENSTHKISWETVGTVPKVVVTLKGLEYDYDMDRYVRDEYIISPGGMDGMDNTGSLDFVVTPNLFAMHESYTIELTAPGVSNTTRFYFTLQKCQIEVNKVLTLPSSQAREKADEDLDNVVYAGEDSMEIKWTTVGELGKVNIFYGKRVLKSSLFGAYWGYDFTMESFVKEGLPGTQNSYIWKVPEDFELGEYLIHVQDAEALKAKNEYDQCQADAPSTVHIKTRGEAETSAPTKEPAKKTGSPTTSSPTKTKTTAPPTKDWDHVQDDLKKKVDAIDDDDESSAGTIGIAVGAVCVLGVVGAIFKLSRGKGSMKRMKSENWQAGGANVVDSSGGGGGGGAKWDDVKLEMSSVDKKESVATV